MLILLSVKSIENSNLRDWSFIKRINGQIRLKERRFFCVRDDIVLLSPKSACDVPMMSVLGGASGKTLRAG